MQVTLAAGEARHSLLVSHGRHGAGLGRWRGQRRVVVRRWTRMRHTWTASTGKSLPKRPALRVAAGSRLARVPAVPHVHSAQGLGQDTHLDSQARKSCVIIGLAIPPNEIPRQSNDHESTRSRVTSHSRRVDSFIRRLNIFTRSSRVNLIQPPVHSRSNWNKSRRNRLKHSLV